MTATTNRYNVKKARAMRAPSTDAQACCGFLQAPRSAPPPHPPSPATRSAPRAIKPDRLDPVRSFRAEYVERATEWISATIPNQGHHRGRAYADNGEALAAQALEVDWIGGMSPEAPI
jgi:hypothetical protein